MGQQQLLLLVLGIVIVGLAVVLGIQAFAENQEKAEIDNFTTTGVGMAAEIIAHYHKPTAQGGAGGDAANLADLTISDLGYELEPSQSTDYYGWAFTGTLSNNILKYVAADTEHPYVHIHAMPRQTGMMRVEVHVFGPSEDCFVVRHGRYEIEDWSDGKAEGTAPDNPNPAACSW